MAFDQGSIPKDLRPVNVARLNAEDPHISNSSGVGRSPEGFYSNPPRPDSSSPQSTPVYFTVSAADPAFTSLGFSNTAIDPTQAAALPMWGGCWPTPVSHPGVSAPHMSVTPPANLSNPNPLTNRSGSNGVELASDDGGEDSVSGRKVKFLCSFGGKIIPRPSDGMLRYVGGQTRIISVKKDVSFNELVQKMMGIYGQPVVIKYQLPDEDLDALVSISCPDDLENMMEEYENLLERSSDGSSKLRVFLFSASEIEASGLAKFEDLQDNGQKYVDAVNGVAEGGVVGGMTRKGSIASVTSTQNSDLSGSEAVDNLVTCQEVSGPPSTSILSPGSDSTINSENPLRPSGIDANSSAPPSSSSSFPMAVPVSPGPPPVVVSLPETSLERTMHLPLQQQPPLKGYDLPPQQSTGKFPPPPSPYLQGFVDSRQEPLSNMTTQYQNFPPSVLYGNHPMVMTGRPVLLQPHYGETIPGVAPQQLLSPVHMSVASSSSHVTANPSMIQQMPSQSVVAVQADQSYNAFQAQVHHPGGVAGYGWHQVPHQEHVAFSEGWVPHHQPQVMMSENVARMEDCGMCQKQLPHAHSDSAVPDQKDSGIPSTTMSDVNSLYRSLRLDDVSRIHGINQGIVTGQGEVAGMGMAPPLQSEEPIQRIYPHMSHVNPETFVSKPVTSGNPIGGGMPFITTEPMSHELAAPREDKIESNTSGGFVRPVEHFQMSPPVISPSSEQGRSSPIDQPRKNEIFDQSSQHTLPNTDYTNPSLITEANSVVPMTSHTNLEPASVNNNLPSSVSPSNWAGNMQDSANSLFSNQDPFYFRHESHFPPPKPTKITTRREGSGPRNPHLENRPVNNGEYNMQGHFVDPSSLPPTSNLSKDQGSDQILSTRGSSEDLAKQELQTTAEGVAASPLQPSMSSNVNSSDGSHGRGIENSNDHVIPSKTEGMNVKSEKANPGFPLADSLGRLQIIKNSDLEELRELGSGTFGTVYYGKWRGTDVAIKRINDRCFAGKPSEQERMREDFWNEAIKLADLHHPNVVAFYGVVTDGPGDSMATVTEYMVNGSLRTALQKNERTLDKRKKILIAMDVAFGMEYLHFRKIVHFDLKSDNLLVNLRDPHRPICKVGDLGLSKVKCQTLISGGVRGTLPWMAPELLNGSSSLVSEKVDVFSYGIVMWELITGDEPYADLHYGAIIGGIVSNTLRPAVPDDCDPDWKSLMERCWSAEPNERPSFTEVANELRAMAAKLPPKSSNQGSTQRASNNVQGA